MHRKSRSRLATPGVPAPARQTWCQLTRTRNYLTYSYPGHNTGFLTVKRRALWFGSVLGGDCKRRYEARSSVINHQGEHDRRTYTARTIFRFFFERDCQNVMAMDLRWSQNMSMKFSGRFWSVCIMFLYKHTVLSRCLILKPLKPLYMLSSLLCPYIHSGRFLLGAILK